jgi:hypothetical protein
VFIEHPLENSMASFDFITAVLNDGTTFVFGSWIYVAVGSGVFNIHLADTSKPEASTATRCSDLDEFIANLDEMLLLDLAREIEKMSILDATSTRAAPGLPGLESTRCKEDRTRFLFGLRNAALVYQKVMRFESLFDLEEDLSHLLKI